MAPRPATADNNVAFRNSAEELDRDRLLAAVLITDIVDSTKLAARMGDRRWLALLGKHDAITRRQIRLFGGKEVRNCGDGFLATFDSSTRAIRCAGSIAELVGSLGIVLRSGIHAGEIHLKRGEISGISVHLAARIASMAQAGESLVSKTARDLATGSEIPFEDRGMHLLRGASEQTHLYAVRTGSRASALNGGGVRRDLDPEPGQAAAIRQFA